MERSYIDTDLQAARQREARERVEQRQREARERVEQRQREAQERTARLHQEARERVEQRQQEVRERVDREKLQDPRHEAANPFPFLMFESTARNLFKDLGGYAAGDEQTRTPHPTRPEEQLDPAEIKRQKLMATLPLEKREALGTFDEGVVRNFVADVDKSRSVAPDQTDWDRHVVSRRRIETEAPDPLMVQRAQISGILLEGTRAEAHYPF